MKLLNNYLLLRPNKKQIDSGLALPETFTSRSSSCLVLDCGPNVKHGIKKGEVVLVDANFSDKKFNRVEGTHDFYCPDSYVFAIYRHRKIVPLGRKILIKRHNNERSENGIVVAADGQKETDQSLLGRVVNFGILPRKKIKGKFVRWKTSGLGIGDEIQLKGWNENMIEIDLDGEYHLIVNEEDIVFIFA